MKLRLKRSGSEVRLTKNNFLAQGGEGSVYVRNGVAYKIYSDQSKAIPLRKIEELSGISRKEVIKPDDLLLDTKGKPVGYSMRHAQDTQALCRIFTPAFKKRSGVGPKQIGRLVSNMRDVLKHIHSCRVLVVDLNEFNLLVGKSLDSVIWIDVDSWQTPSFPATAIMDSVRDRHASSFSAKTDWFSFAIVSFQLWMGIHPYKGKHPKIKTLDDRMVGNLSVFNRDVSMPKVCPPLDIIPQDWLSWYREVLEEGHRIPPPDSMGASTIIRSRPVVVLSGALSMSEILSCDKDILHFMEIGPHRVVFTEDGASWSRVTRSGVSPDSAIGLAPGGKLIRAQATNGKLVLTEILTGSDIPSMLSADKTSAIDGRLYVKSGDGIHEMGFLEMPNGKLRASSKKVASVMPEATRMFDGVVIQDMLGSWYASVFPAPGKSFQFRLKELDGWKLVEAKHDNRVLMVVGAKKGSYRKWIMVLKPDYSGYMVREAKDVAYSGLNFVVLDTGVCAHLNEDEKLELFSNDPRSKQTKVVSSDQLDSGMVLCRCGGSVAAIKGDVLYRISTRKP